MPVGADDDRILTLPVGNLLASRFVVGRIDASAGNQFQSNILYGVSVVFAGFAQYGMQVNA